MLYVASLSGTRRMARQFVQSRLINRLRLAAGDVIPASELISAIWPNPDDEPKNPLTNIAIAAMKLRAAGFPIRNEHGRGYRFAPTLWEIPS